MRSLRDHPHKQRNGKVVFGRLQRHVAMIVVAQFAAMLTDDNGTPLLLVKRIVAGAAPGHPRFADLEDFDTVARLDIEEVHERLAEAGETGWEGVHSDLHRRGDRCSRHAREAATIHLD